MTYSPKLRKVIHLLFSQIPSKRTGQRMSQLLLQDRHPPRWERTQYKIQQWTNNQEIQAPRSSPIIKLAVMTRPPMAECLRQSKLITSRVIGTSRIKMLGHIRKMDVSNHYIVTVWWFWFTLARQPRVSYNRLDPRRNGGANSTRQKLLMGNFCKFSYFLFLINFYFNSRTRKLFLCFDNRWEEDNWWNSA